MRPMILPAALTLLITLLASGVIVGGTWIGLRAANVTEPMTAQLVYLIVGLVLLLFALISFRAATSAATPLEDSLPSAWPYFSRQSAPSPKPRGEKDLEERRGPIWNWVFVLVGLIAGGVLLFLSFHANA